MTSQTNVKRMAVHGSALLVCVGGLLYMAQNCGPNPGSEVKDLATTDSIKTGMFLPTVVDADRTDSFNLAGGEGLTADELAREVEFILDNNSPGKFLSTTWGDEQILLVDHQDGTHPSPVASLKNGVRYRWDSLATRVGDRVATTATFFRYRSDGGQPTLDVKDMFVMREATTQTGAKELFIVPWLRHLGSETTDAKLWRIGNSVIDANLGIPVLAFEEIGRHMWRLSGPYRDQDVQDGTIFWSRDLKSFSSLTPGRKVVVRWKKQDSDSMDRVTTSSIEEASVPKTVAKAVARELAIKTPVLRNLGFDLTTTDPNVIRVYPLRNRHARASDVVGGTAGSGGFGLQDDSVNDDDFFTSYVNEPEEDAGLSLAGSGRPAGLPSQYTTAKSLGRHNQVTQVSTGWWPFNGAKDVSTEREYFYVERPDPASGGQTTRKVVYKDSAGAWKEESATKFMTQVEKMNANSGADKQRAVEARGRAMSAEAAERLAKVDKDAGKFVDKGWVGHMTDIGVAGGKGALGPAVKLLPGVDAAGKVIINGSATVVGETLKTAADGNTAKDPKAAGEKILLNAGIGVASDVAKPFLPPGVISTAKGAQKVGAEIMDGDTDGAVRQGALTGVDIAKDVTTAIVPVTDPLTGAAIGVSVEAGKKTLEAGMLVGSLNSTRLQTIEATGVLNESLQMGHDRRFSETAGPQLNDLFYGGGDQPAPTEHAAPTEQASQPVAEPAAEPAFEEPAATATESTGDEGGFGLQGDSEEAVEAH